MRNRASSGSAAKSTQVAIAESGVAVPVEIAGDTSAAVRHRGASRSLTDEARCTLKPAWVSYASSGGFADLLATIAFAAAEVAGLAQVQRTAELLAATVDAELTGAAAVASARLSLIS
jgi:hypothetical protein